MQRLRRLVATLLLASLTFASAESLIADACDGDAESTASVGTSDTPCFVRADSPSNSTPDGPRHTFHVCHCIHTHNGSIAAQVVLTLPFSQVTIRSAELGLMPPGRSLQPPQRPPLV